MLLGRGFVTNNAPSISVPGAQSAVSNVALAITGTSIADTDSNPQTVTLSASHGTFTLASTTGLSFTAGDGTADATMTFSGSVANVNTAIATLTYTSDADYSGADSLAISTNDGAGGTDSDSVAITVTYTPLSAGASLIAWFDGNQEVYEDAGTDAAETTDPLYRWGNTQNSDYIQSTTLANRPIYTVGANGEGYCSGDGTNDYLQGTFAAATAYASMDIWLSFKPDATTPKQQLVLMRRSTDSNPIAEIYDTSGTSGTYLSRTRNDSGSLNATPTESVTGDWKTVALQYTGAATRLLVNNVVEQTVAQTGTITLDKLTLFNADDLTYPGNGSVAQIVIINGNLSATAATGLQAYLSGRFPT